VVINYLATYQRQTFKCQGRKLQYRVDPQSHCGTATHVALLFDTCT